MLFECIAVTIVKDTTAVRLEAEQEHGGPIVVVISNLSIHRVMDYMPGTKYELDI